MAGELDNLFVIDESRGILGLVSNEIIQTLIIILIFVVISLIVKSVSKLIIKKLNDDEAFKNHLNSKITAPVFACIILFGLFVACRNFSYFEPFSVWVTRIFFALIGLTLSYLFSSIITLFISHWLKVKKNYEKTPQLINRIVTLTVFSVTIIMILGFFGVQVAPLIATLGIGGLAIGLALQPTLTNFFAGLQIISDKPIEVGHFVEIENGAIKGYVEDIGWRSTRIKTLANERIIVPNNKLAESIIMNNTSAADSKIVVIIPCGVSYESNLEKVEKISLDVAKKVIKGTEGAVKDYEPKIRFNDFGDSNINFKIIVKVKKYQDQFVVKHELIKALKVRFDKEKIEMSYPVRKIVYENKKKRK